MLDTELEIRKGGGGDLKKFFLRFGLKITGRRAPWAPPLYLPLITALHVHQLVAPLTNEGPHTIPG